MDEQEKKTDSSLHIQVNVEQIDTAIEKANRLVELLREASDLIDSLSGARVQKGAPKNLIQQVVSECLRFDSRHQGGLDSV